MEKFICTSSRIRFLGIIGQGTQTKIIKGKTDVKNVQSLQKLPQLGCLRGSFLQN